MTTTNIEGLLGREGILLAIDNHPTFAFATVHHTKLTVIKEILILDARIHIKTQIAEVLQLQVFVHWHSTTEDETVVV